MTETKRKVGRPTKYTPAFLKLAKAYLDDFADEHEHVIPSIAGLSEISNISRETLHTWGSEEGKEEFSDILVKLLAKQERLLLNNGLSGGFNANICKLVLGKHGYHEKQEHTGKDGKDLYPSVIKIAYD